MRAPELAEQHEHLPSLPAREGRRRARQRPPGWGGTTAPIVSVERPPGWGGTTAPIVSVERTPHPARACRRESALPSRGGIWAPRHPRDALRRGLARGRFAGGRGAGGGALLRL